VGSIAGTLAFTRMSDRWFCVTVPRQIALVVSGMLHRRSLHQRMACVMIYIYIYIYIDIKSEKGKSNLESTDRKCFPVLFSQVNLTSTFHSFLRVSSKLYHLMQTKTHKDGIKARKSWLLNVMYVGLYINFDVLTVVNIWLPVLCVVPPCIVCF
jgi:hypothetical protein